MSQILIVDDSKVQRGFLKLVFSWSGIEIMEAENGNIALELIDKKIPDCMIIDMLMPEKNGLEVMSDLNQRKINIPTIVLTSDVQESTIAKCKQLGAAFIFHKPFVKEKLLRAVQDCLKESTEGVNFRVKEEQLDGFKEVVTIGVGKAASLLNSLLKSHVTILVPHIAVYYDIKTLKKTEQDIFEEKLCSIQLDYRGDSIGKAFLIFPNESATRLVSLLLKDVENPDDIDSFKKEGLLEVGNIILNGVIGSISNLLKKKIDYLIPSFREGNFAEVLDMNENSLCLILTRTHFIIPERDLKGDIVLIFSIDSYNNLVKEIDYYVRSAYE